MSLLTLPLWNFFKDQFNDAYPSLTFDTADYWVCAFVSFLLALVIIGICGMICGFVYDKIDTRKATYEILSARVIDRVYTGATSSSGIGTAVIPNSSGEVGIGVVSTSSSSPESFLLFVKPVGSNIKKIEITMDQYYNVSINDQVKIKVATGGLSKKELSTVLM